MARTWKSDGPNSPVAGSVPVWTSSQAPRNVISAASHRAEKEQHQKNKDLTGGCQKKTKVIRALISRPRHSHQFLRTGFLGYSSESTTVEERDENVLFHRFCQRICDLQVSRQPCQRHVFHLFGILLSGRTRQF